MKTVVGKMYSIVIVLVVVLIVPSVAHAAFSSDSGSGTSSDPYIITTCAELQSINDYITDNSGGAGTYFKLGGDIDCDIAPYNTGDEFTPLGSASSPFKGDFDGNGHVISGLHINSFVFASRYESGLFGGTYNAAIYNIGLENVDITLSPEDLNTANAGALVSEPAGNTTIHDVYATGTINLETTGSGIAEIGGLVGLPEGNTTIDHAYSTVAVTINASNNMEGVQTGGLVGHLNSSTVTVKNSFATVLPSVSKLGDIGVLIGNGDGGTIINSYSVGSPLIGYADNATVDDISAGDQTLASFYQTSPLHAVYASQDDPWDFTNTWGFADLSSLPVLSVHGLVVVNQTPSQPQQTQGFISGGSAWFCTDPSATNYQGSFPGVSVTSGCVYAVTPTPTPVVSTTTPAQAVSSLQPAASSILVRDLNMGMTGDDVLALQKLLNANGFVIAKTGQGSLGNETNSFGTLTYRALVKYQKANNIPATGFFGPKTRAQMKTVGLI